VAENQYHVMYYNDNTVPEKVAHNISLFEADPTSYSKTRTIMLDTKYSNVFIIMEKIEDADYSLKNIRLIDDKIRILLVDQWDDSNIGQEEENIIILHGNELLAAHIYDNLPNVPVIAQNVGMGKGEIMEIHVPFGSTYAFRHVRSIFQNRWKIVAIYRNEQQIIPTDVTMIRPNDTLLVLGNPLVLNGVYKSINKRIGLFPEPFGKNLYLLLDFRFDQDNMLLYLEESIYLLEQIEDKSLYIRVLYPNNFKLLDKIKEYESEKITLFVSYDEIDIKSIIAQDAQEYDIGLVLNSIDVFDRDNIKNILHDLKKIVYIFGDKLLYDIEESVIIMSENEKMESISSTAFDISESLGLNLTLGNFDPDGDFESRKIIIEHYETLSHILNMDINIEQKIANPIRELSAMHNILQIIPFDKELNTDNFMKIISTRIQDYLLSEKKHPKLLVPFALE